tara:strand:+ start:282 stop:989 length:708 start_codon:yes stop_codon:yes gene_type:complete
MSAIPEEVLGLRVEVVRSRRRTAALHIVGNELQVRVPNQVRDESIIEILQKKRPWIRRKVVQLKEVPVPQPKEFVSGEAFPFLGQNFRLKVQEGHRVGVQLSEGYLLTTVRPSEVGEQRKQRIQQYLKSWYRSRAEERLQEKVERYSKQIGVSPKGLRVREFKSKWGSCDSRGTIAFNLNLIKAPHPIVDYVVIHELCHMIQPNHSKNFWKEVEKHDASYKEHRAWLKQRAGELI